jgi:hypothetical protein
MLLTKISRCAAIGCYLLLGQIFGAAPALEEGSP